MPCKLCYEKGFPCGADEKVWGQRSGLPNGRTPLSNNRKVRNTIEPVVRGCAEVSEEIPRQPVTPNGLTLSSADALCIEWVWRYLSTRQLGFCGEAYPRAAECMVRRYGRNISSRAVRHAVIVVAHRCRHGVQSCYDKQALQSLDYCYQYTRKAIQLTSYIDVAYASYFMAWSSALHWPKSGDASEMLKHLCGFMVCLQHLAKSSLLDAEEIVLMKYQWISAFRMVSHHPSTRFDSFVPRGHRITVAEISIELSRLVVACSNLEVDCSNQPLWVQDLHRKMQLELSGYEIQRCLHFWYSAHLAGEDPKINSSLRSAYDTVLGQLDVLRTALMQHHSLFPTFVPVRSLEGFTYLEALECASIAYNAFMFVLFLEPFTEMTIGHTQVLDAVKAIGERLERVESSAAAVPHDSLWLLFLTNLISEKIGSYCGKYYIFLAKNRNVRVSHSSCNQ